MCECQNWNTIYGFKMALNQVLKNKNNGTFTIWLCDQITRNTTTICVTHMKTTKTKGIPKDTKWPWQNMPNFNMEG
jgi:hypothetical protein